MDKEKLKEEIKERLLEKNSSRSMYFLQLDFEEVCEVIDSHK